MDRKSVGVRDGVVRRGPSVGWIGGEREDPGEMLAACGLIIALADTEEEKKIMRALMVVIVTGTVLGSPPTESLCVFMVLLRKSIGCVVRTSTHYYATCQITVRRDSSI